MDQFFPTQFEFERKVTTLNAQILGESVKHLIVLNETHSFQLYPFVI